MAGFTRIYPDNMLKSGNTEVGGQRWEVGDGRSIDDLRLHRPAEPARSKPARERLPELGVRLPELVLVTGRGHLPRVNHTSAVRNRRRSRIRYDFSEVRKAGKRKPVGILKRCAVVSGLVALQPRA